MFYKRQPSKLMNRLYEMDMMTGKTPSSRARQYHDLINNPDIKGFRGTDSLAQQHNRGIKRSHNILHKLSFLLSSSNVTQKPHKMFSKHLYTTSIHFGNYNTDGHTGIDYHRYLHHLGKLVSNYNRISDLTNLDNSFESKFNNTPYAINNHTHGLKYSDRNYTDRQLSLLRLKASNYFSQRLHKPVDVKIKHFKDTKGSISKSLEAYVKYINKESGLPNAKNMSDYNKFANKPLDERRHLESVNKQGTYKQHCLHNSIRRGSKSYNHIKSHYTQSTQNDDLSHINITTTNHQSRSIKPLMTQLNDDKKMIKLNKWIINVRKQKGFNITKDIEAGLTTAQKDYRTVKNQIVRAKANDVKATNTLSSNDDVKAVHALSLVTQRLDVISNDVHKSVSCIVFISSNKLIDHSGIPP